MCPDLVEQFQQQGGRVAECRDELDHQNHTKHRHPAADRASRDRVERSPDRVVTVHLPSQPQTAARESKPADQQRPPQGQGRPSIPTTSAIGRPRRRVFERQPHRRSRPGELRHIVGHVRRLDVVLQADIAADPRQHTRRRFQPVGKRESRVGDVFPGGLDVPVFRQPHLGGLFELQRVFQPQGVGPDAVAGRFQQVQHVRRPDLGFQFIPLVTRGPESVQPVLLDHRHGVVLPMVRHPDRRGGHDARVVAVVKIQVPAPQFLDIASRQLAAKTLGAQAFQLGHHFQPRGLADAVGGIEGGSDLPFHAGGITLRHDLQRAGPGINHQRLPEVRLRNIVDRPRLRRPGGVDPVCFPLKRHPDQHVVERTR